jgi:hypothetical protein
MKVGQNILIDPKLTGLKDWINAIVIKIRNNPFIGLEIAAKDEKGVIYFDSSKYFKELN